MDARHGLAGRLAAALAGVGAILAACASAVPGWDDAPPARDAGAREDDAGWVPDDQPRQPRPGQRRPQRPAQRPRDRQPGEAQPPREIPVPAGWTLTSDVKYGPGDVQVMDIIHPAAAGDPLPTVLLIPGGGFIANDRRTLMRQAIEFASAGFVAAVMQYTSANAHLQPSLDNPPAPEHAAFPQAVVDAKQAAAFLCAPATASKFRVDPARLSAAGASAGAYLAAMLALTGPDDAGGTFNPAGAPAEPVVVCAVGWSGIYDLRPGTQQRVSAGSESAIAQFLGVSRSADPALAAAASALTYVNAGDRPMLLIAGEQDSTIDPWNSRTLAEALRSAGVESEAVVLAGAPHVVWREPEAVSRAIAFIRAHAGGAAANQPARPQPAPRAPSRPARPALAGMAPNLVLHVVREGEGRREPGMTPWPSDPSPWTDSALRFELYGGGLNELGPAAYRRDRAGTLRKVEEQAGRMAQRVRPGQPVIIDLEGPGQVGVRTAWSTRGPEEDRPLAREIQAAYIAAFQKTHPGGHIGFYHDMISPYRRGQGLSDQARAFNTANMSVFQKGRMVVFIGAPGETVDASNVAQVRQWWVESGREMARLLRASRAEPDAHGYVGTICFELSPHGRKTSRGGERLVEMERRETAELLSAANEVALENPDLRTIAYVWIQWLMPSVDDPRGARAAFDGYGWLERVAIPAAREALGE
jgi:acetyl esterase/lipase